MTNEEALAFVRKGKYAEADENIIAALEKQIPKKIIKKGDGYIDLTYLCPNCGEKDIMISVPHWVGRTICCFSCCPACGQLLDWSDDNENN